MSQAYRLTKRAEADVEAIVDFIAADSIDAAVKVVLALEDAFVLVASRPGIGHSREDLTERPPPVMQVCHLLVCQDSPAIAWRVVNAPSRRAPPTSTCCVVLVTLNSATAATCGNNRICAPTAAPNAALPN